MLVPESGRLVGIYIVSLNEYVWKMSVKYRQNTCQLFCFKIMLLSVAGSGSSVAGCGEKLVQLF